MSDHETEVAIQNEDVTKVEEAQKSPRELAMDALADAHNDRLSEELGIEINSGDESPEKITKPETNDGDGERKQPETAKSGSDTDLSSQIDAQLIEPGEGVMVKTKVDGVEKNVPLSDVLRDYQKGQAADRRLEEANRLLREAEEARKSVGNTGAARDPDQSGSGKETKAAPDDVKEVVKTALSRLYEGDEDAAAEALAGLIAGSKGSNTQAPAIDTNQVASLVKQQLEAESAFETIQKDYPKIVNDPDLNALAASKAERLMRDGKPRHEALLEATKQVADLIGAGQGRPGEVTQTTRRDEKLERKQGLDQVRTASASVPSSSQQAEEGNPSSVIADMASKRLGQTLNLGGR